VTPRLTNKSGATPLVEQAKARLFRLRNLEAGCNVQRFAAKPFVALTVNSDQDKETLRQSLKIWRSHVALLVERREERSDLPDLGHLVFPFS
jgi:hypothetical protein